MTSILQRLGLTTLKATRPLGCLLTHPSVNTLQVRDYAARKGKRMLKQALLRKERLLAGLPAKEPKKKKEDSTKYKIDAAVPTSRPLLDMREKRQGKVMDDIWLLMFYPRPIYSLEEAISMHIATHHPTVYNMPNSLLTLTLELDMKLSKKNKFMGNFSGTFTMPYHVDIGSKKNVLVFCKQAEDARKALDAGALMAGGTNLIKDLNNGRLMLDDYDYIVAHVDIMPDLTAVRGIMKRKFPVQTRGTIGSDVEALVHKFQRGVDYFSTTDPITPQNGFLDTHVGALNMPLEQLEANIMAVLEKINAHKKLMADPFIKTGYLTSQPSPEKLAFDIRKYVPHVPPVEEDSDDD